jgi:hypothetical protein
MFSQKKYTAKLVGILSEDEKDELFGLIGQADTLILDHEDNGTYTAQFGELTIPIRWTRKEREILTIKHALDGKTFTFHITEPNN